ncbi:MAG: hypothetical protein IPP81_16115 [Chitinophagaceae bacterium]|nr:hypothetical protein [Chitinophagaceae bacterium]
MVKLFGTTLSETKKVFETGIHAGGEQVTSEDRLKVIGRIIVTVLLIFLATYLLVTGNNKEMGGTIVGAIIGYWIK